MNLDDDGEVYNWPWLYAVQTGQWNLTDAQAKTARISAARRLLHGRRFLGHRRMGQCSWPACSRVFPDREPVDLNNTDAIFHTVYDLDDRYQVASEGSVQRGRS